MMSDLFLVSVLLLLLLLLLLPPLLLPFIAEGVVEEISIVAAVLTLLLLVMMLCADLFPLSLTLICWFKVCWLRTIFDDDDDDDNTSDEEEDDDDALAEMVMLCIILSTTFESTSSSPPDIDSDSLELCTISPPTPTTPSPSPSLVAVVDELVGIVMLVDDTGVPSMIEVCIVVSPPWFLLASLASASFKAMASRLIAFFSYRRQVTSSLLLTS